MGKKFLATLLLSFLFLVGWAQNGQPAALGIGFAVASDPYRYEDMTHYDGIYRDSDLTTKLRNSSQNKIWPFFYKPDYGLYHFICLEKTKEYYKVLINDSAIAYIPNDSSFYFTSWEAMLLEASMERITDDNPILEDWKNPSSRMEHSCKPTVVQVREVIESKGVYWVRVSFSADCEPDPGDGSPLKYGWIKWRTKDKLLVRVLLLC